MPMMDWSNKEERDTIDNMLQELESLEHGISEWEENFLESVRDQFDHSGTISPRQKEILVRIYEEKTWV